MNLQPINPRPSLFSFRLQCIACGCWADAATVHADLDGEPFKAYYCQSCTNKTKDQS